MTLNTVKKALYGALSGSSALTTALGGTAIYDEAAPVNAGLPYVLMQHRAGGEVNASPRREIDVTYRVFAVAEGAAQSGTLASLIDDALHDTALSADGGWVNFWTARQDEYFAVEQVEQGQYYRAGADYGVRMAKGDAA